MCCIISSSGKLQEKNTVFCSKRQRRKTFGEINCTKCCEVLRKEQNSASKEHCVKLKSVRKYVFFKLFWMWQEGRHGKWWYSTMIGHRCWLQIWGSFWRPIETEHFKEMIPSFQKQLLKGSEEIWLESWVWGLGRQTIMSRPRNGDSPNQFRGSANIEEVINLEYYWG